MNEIIQKINEIEKRIEIIKDSLSELGEMRPGSLTLQSKGGKSKHYQLSYTHRMKGKTEYIRPVFKESIESQIANYKIFKSLTEEWVALGIEHSRLVMKKKNLKPGNNNHDRISFILRIQPSPILPQVLNNKDFSNYSEQLKRIDKIITKSGIELEFSSAYLEKMQRNSKKKLSDKMIKKYTLKSIICLRCNILHMLTQESFRKLSIHIAESTVLQMFCKVWNIDVIKVPSKSELQRYSMVFDESIIRDNVMKIIHYANSEDNNLNFINPFHCEDIYVDATCLKANIHFPVDWLLLRDGMKTLLEAIIVIRKHGIKNRIKDPLELLREINNKSINMTNTGRKSGSKKERKRILRELKEIEKRIRRHGYIYRNKLESDWEEKTDLTQQQVNCIIDRIDNMLELLPRAQYKC